MALSNELISEFVKITNDKPTETKETVIYGTVDSTADGVTYVTFDGATMSTPVEKTVEVKDEDRVVVMIKNHTATVTGNLTDPGVTVTRVTQIEHDISTCITTDELNAEVAKINEVVATKAAIADLNTEAAKIKELQADNVTIKGELEANEGRFDDLKTTKLDASIADITYAKIDYVDSSVGDINTLLFGSATGDTIQTSFANSVIAQLGDAQIKSAMIESVSADKITAGDIITNNVRVKSEDGSLIISDETLQISDGSRVRVQIGKDSANDYSINVWDQNGNLMFSKGGITDAAIKEAIIRNDMVSDTANISAHKLDIDSLFEEINDSSNTIKSSQIYIDDENQTLDVAFKSLTTTVTDQGESISSQGTAISTIQGQISSKVWQQDINAATDEMSTQYSTLEQELDGFRSTVSSTYVTKNEFDNLEIGSKNLLRNTQSFMYWSKAASSMTAENGVITWPSVSTLQWRSMHNRDIPIKYSDVHDRELTISFDVRSDEYEAINAEANRGFLISFQLYKDGDTTRYKYYDKTYHTFVLSSEWQRVVYTFVANDDFFTLKNSDRDQTVNLETDNFIVSLYDYSLYSMQIRNVQLEYGNVATTYAPSPEDLTDRVTQAESQIIQNTESISQTVSKTEMTTAIENIQVGGRNWLIDTATSKIVTGNNTSNQCISLYDFNDQVKELANNTITCSFKYTISDYTGGMFRINTSPTVWQRISDIITPSGDGTFTTSMTVTLPSGTGYTLVQVRMDDFIGSIEFSNMKVELGNKATDWSPAPEDMATNVDLNAVENRVSVAESSIVQNADNITSVVSRTTTNENAISSLEQTADGLTLRLDNTDSNVTAAQNTANNAAKTATNYLAASADGLIVGDHTAGTLKKNILIDTDSVDIRDGTKVLASYQGNKISLGIESDEATIGFCGDNATLTAVKDSSGYYDGIRFDSQYFRTRGNNVSLITDVKGTEDSDESKYGRLLMTTAESTNKVGAALDTIVNYGEKQNFTHIAGGSTANDDGSSTYATISAEHYTGSIWKQNVLKIEPTKTTLYDLNNSGLLRPWNKILWNGTWYMNGSQEASLSEAISAQPTGIVLIFSEFYDNAASNTAFHEFFIPKQMITSHKSCGHCFQMSTSNLAYFATKYLYIGDTAIKGHDNNTLVSGSECGIARTNTRFVMRYVIGV